jgi:hypothetical protein
MQILYHFSYHVLAPLTFSHIQTLFSFSPFPSNLSECNNKQLEISTHWILLPNQVIFYFCYLVLLSSRNEQHPIRKIFECDMIDNPNQVIFVGYLMTFSVQKIHSLVQKDDWKLERIWKWSWPKWGNILENVWMNLGKTRNLRTASNLARFSWHLWTTSLEHYLWTYPSFKLNSVY